MTHFMWKNRPDGDPMLLQTHARLARANPSYNNYPSFITAAYLQSQLYFQYHKPSCTLQKTTYAQFERRLTGSVDSACAHSIVQRTCTAALAAHELESRHQ